MTTGIESGKSFIWRQGSILGMQALVNAGLGYILVYERRNLADLENRKRMRVWKSMKSS